jgi:prepilin-type N-terminal cleavage/methylation domain-containing protein
MKLNKSGFTIVELMIAISIFSGLLIIMVYSFLFSLDAFMKAYVSSKTQETLRNVDQSISTSINLGTNGVVYLKPVQYNISNGNYTITSQGFCIGQYRYSYILSQESDSNGNYNYVNLSIPILNHNLVQDVMTGGCNSNMSAQDLSSPLNTSAQQLSSSSKELAGNNIGILSFSLAPSNTIGNTPVYNFLATFGYGNNLNVSYESGKLSSSCPGTFHGGNFCALSSFNDYINQRVY